MTRDISKLMDAICEGWAKCLPPPYGDGEFSAAIDGMTDCNRFVHFVCVQMGYKKFLRPGGTIPILANEMFDYMVSHQGEWQELLDLSAQWYANQGVIVIAAWKNSDGPHGHVCIVRPGVLGTSEHWNSNQVPKVANVSSPQFCRIDRGANYAFKSRPRYFACKEMV